MTLRVECCRAEKADRVICQRELGHPGPHVHRSGRRGLGDPVVRWFTAVEYTGPQCVETPVSGPRTRDIGRNQPQHASSPQQSTIHNDDRTEK